MAKLGEKLETPRGKAFLLVLLLCLPLGFWIVTLDTSPHVDSLCPLRLTTGLACPGCGMTRGTYLAYNGHLEAAAMMNPFSLAFVLLMFAWTGTLAFDLATGRNTSSRFWKGFTHWANKLFWPLLALVLLNWMWCIDKFSDQ